MRDFDAQRAVEIQRAAEHRDAFIDIERQRLAGDRPVVDARATAPHHAIGGNPRTGRHLHHIAGADRLVRYFFDHAVAFDAPDVARGQPAKRADRLLRAKHAALFERMSKGHDDRQQGRGGHVAGRPCRQHGKRNQPVGDAMQARRLQAVPGAGEHRPRHQQRREPSQYFGELRAAGCEIAPRHRQQQQAARQQSKRDLPRNDAPFRSGERDARSIVIVRMGGVRVVVVVMAEPVVMTVLVLVVMLTPRTVSAMATMPEITRPTGRTTLDRFDVRAH